MKGRGAPFQFRRFRFERVSRGFQTAFVRGLSIRPAGHGMSQQREDTDPVNCSGFVTGTSPASLAARASLLLAEQPCRIFIAVPRT
jgi:hypothetical protein